MAARKRTRSGCPAVPGGRLRQVVARVGPQQFIRRRPVGPGFQRPPESGQLHRAGVPQHIAQFHHHAQPHRVNLAHAELAQQVQRFRPSQVPVIREPRARLCQRARLRAPVGRGEVAAEADAVTVPAGAAFQGQRLKFQTARPCAAFRPQFLRTQPPAGLCRANQGSPPGPRGTASPPRGGTARCRRRGCGSGPHGPCRSRTPPGRSRGYPSRSRRRGCK